MRKRDEQTLRDSLRNDGWSDEDIDAFIVVEEDEEGQVIENEYFFDAFMEASMEDEPNA